ncbi:hypothetical protein HXX76_011690 [Chlamydomonas incerta]|uniref:Protein kinase domain-containing protein n=1 Tax=Chlamydomonas incerta TaxID=51695 RepID=A0A835SGB3_CHLIN|nr:hypothetical protein HXX76_011690 [Chlamydomonas incerta]|eukprot:KAG2426459.1 hypothetical protein HXX76_011690 [Chlamydomonas incerta]
MSSAKQVWLDLSQLRFIQQIGAGGFAVVWLAECLGTRVAVKIFCPAPRYAGRSIQFFEAMFLREAALCARQSHRNLVAYRGLARLQPGTLPGLTTASWAILTDFCDGGSLRDVLIGRAPPGLHSPQQQQQQQQGQQQGQGQGGQNPAYSEEQALTWLLDVAEALAFLHASSPTVIHRDVKAENVLLQWEGGPGGGGRMVAKLADLGLHVQVDHSRPVMLRAKQSAVAPTAEEAALEAAAAVAGYGAGECDCALEMMHEGAGTAEQQQQQGGAPGSQPHSSRPCQHHHHHHHDHHRHHHHPSPSHHHHLQQPHGTPPPAAAFIGIGHHAHDDGSSNSDDSDGAEERRTEDVVVEWYDDGADGADDFPVAPAPQFAAAAVAAAPPPATTEPQRAAAPQPIAAAAAAAVAAAPSRPQQQHQQQQQRQQPQQPPPPLPPHMLRQSEPQIHLRSSYGPHMASAASAAAPNGRLPVRVISSRSIGQPPAMSAAAATAATTSSESGGDEEPTAPLAAATEAAAKDDASAAGADARDAVALAGHARRR